MDAKVSMKKEEKNEKRLNLRKYSHDIAILHSNGISR